MSIAISLVALLGCLLAIISSSLLFRRLRGLPPASDSKIDPPRISIIIPARDEEANLGRLLPSLNRQTLPLHEVIVVNDQSSDATAEVAASNGARVIDGTSPPEGWFGKPWACHQGAQVAEGEVLLFVDSDILFEPEALARLVTLANEHPKAVISVCPWHAVERPYEQLSLFFNLLMVGGIGAFTWKGDQTEKIGLFGQTMWIPKDVYTGVGGHSTVKKTVLENFHLARELEKTGIPKICRIGYGSISMRMFPGGVDELVSSWAKGFSSGAGLTPPLALVLSSVWLSGLMMLTVCLVLSPIGDATSGLILAGCHLAAVVSLSLISYRIGRFRWWNIFLYPLTLLFYQFLFAFSARSKKRGGTVQWKGRDVA